ncbi:hypothetical protein JCM10207_005996 [Rhodosporidiobolus poonsookiae]
MRDSTALIASLSAVFGSLLLAFVLALSRFAYRKHKRGRSVPVDPAYEKTRVTLAGTGAGGAAATHKDGGAEESDEEEGEEKDSEDKASQVRWFGGAYGITPIAEDGPGGTKQYLSGWFGLDAPSTAGWARTPNDDSTQTPRGYGSGASTYTSPTSSLSAGGRKSLFSRAGRAEWRAARKERREAKKAGKEAEKDEGKQEKGKEGKKKGKKPRVSRTTEMSMLEQEAGSDGEGVGRTVERERGEYEEVTLAARG